VDHGSRPSLQRVSKIPSLVWWFTSVIPTTQKALAKIENLSGKIIKARKE
jgi:hypothetical protein